MSEENAFDTDEELLHDDVFEDDDMAGLLPAKRLAATPPAQAMQPSAAAPAVPIRLRASGLYRSRLGSGPLPFGRSAELRLDVDGNYPQATASGVLRGGLQSLHWIASVSRIAANTWRGTIWFRDGATALLPHTRVEVRVSGTLLRPRSARVRFSGAGRAVTHDLDFISPWFERIEFEFDQTSDATPARTIGTHDHPNRPATLPSETLSIEDTFRRAGFDVSVTPTGPMIPIGDAGANSTWSDTELHDAMQLHWSRFANRPQWALWVMHARQHDSGQSLGGIMFDDIGPQHRQGTAIFTDSFISTAPAGDAAPPAWVARMRFWTAVHEMGHAFNLAHSWQKSLGTGWVSPLPDDEEARSFMNYPFRVAGGQSAFFSDFAFRFSDAELLFMRHAPRRFVQMGNAAWFDHHGFEGANASPEPQLRLELRVPSDQRRLQFLEPAMVELKLTNVSADPVLLPVDLLEGGHHLTLVVRRGQNPARVWQPFSTACHQPRQCVLAPKQALYQPIFAGAGKGGWLVDEPGVYALQACLHLPSGEDLVSAPLELRVAPPAQPAEYVLAQDFFNADVGRVLAFDGSRTEVLKTAMDTLRETAAQFGQRAAARHAEVALGMPMRQPGKLLQAGVRGEPVLRASTPDPDEARQRLESALLRDPQAAAATLGHIEYRMYAEQFAAWLAKDAGDVPAAAATMQAARDTLRARNVKPEVVADMESFTQTIAAASVVGAVEAAVGAAAKAGASRKQGEREPKAT